MPGLATPRSVSVSWLAGRWERTLLQSADGAVDTTSRVTWLQGPSLFVDLRRPVEGPGTGFAGTLTQAGSIFTWSHEIELTPWGVADAGTLEWCEGHLVERGVHDGYLEHWHPAHPAAAHPAAAVVPCWGLRLAGPGGRRAILVRVGEDVGWAQRPAAGVGVCLARITGPGTAMITATSSPAALGAQLTWLDTVDCVLVEMSWADRVTRDRWQVTHREEARG
jgi:hypothetical protein